MKKILSSVIFLGIIGLIFGYFIFGKVSGDYVSLKTLINPSENFFEGLKNTITGIKEIRQNILISGAIGSGIGLIFGALNNK